MINWLKDLFLKKEYPVYSKGDRVYVDIFKENQWYDKELLSDRNPNGTYFIHFGYSYREVHERYIRGKL